MKKKYRIFLKTLFVTLVMIFVLGATSFRSFAQEPNLFVVIECMKVKQSDEAKYLAVEKDIWKPIHQERVKQGKILGWLLYKVHYTAENDEYNYATATIFADPANLENPYEGIDPAKVHPNMNIEEAYKKTVESRDLVKRNLIRRAGFAYPENSPGPAPFKYIEVNYMKSKEGNYVASANSIWKPIHQEFINSGTRAGWSLWTAVYPRGSEADFQFVTVNYFKDNSQIGAANMVEAFKKAHPDKHQQTELGKVSATRDIVRVELWEVLDRVMLE